MNASQSTNPQTALVTGATSGLGRATAILLAENGWRVFAAGRSAERRRSIDDLARLRGLPLETLEMDVTSDDSVERAFQEIERRGVRALDAVVNNAGIAIAAPIEEVRYEDLQKQFETNVFSVVRVSQRALPAMRERRRGRIVNMSSIAGKVTMPILGPYSGSKFALEAISDAMRIELHPFGIHVVIIEPGYIRTDMERAAQDLSSAYVAGAERSPYHVVYEGFRRAWDETTRGSKDVPVGCARVILRALTETPPRPRYVVTRRAKLTAFLRRILSDRAFDRSILRATGLDRAGEKT
ncbi:MAG: SDR family oxidoreductase [Acidobacteriota bacterium]|nr:SDR family oxidoreductase [Acidobacteriota bacterium]